jgi:PAS domain S-box-containing protein
VVETAPDAVISIDERGAILFANPATLRIFGHDPTELIGKPLTILMPEFLRKVHEKGFTRYLTTGQRHINWQGTELTGLQKDGREFPIEVSFGELSRDGHKVFTGFIRDISERKQAEDKLRASERTLRELTETIPQMLWSAEADGSINYCNQRVLDYTGLSADQVRGAGWMKSVHQDDIEKLGHAWTAAVSTGEPFQYEFRCRRTADNRYRWCVSSALPLRDREGRVIKWFGSVVDLHDWKEAQQALQMTQTELARVSRLTTMGELAASIAHEVNQPLTAVTNNSSACLRLLAADNLQPEILRRALEEIVADGNRASAVVARIRGFIKKEPAEKNRLNINDVIQEVLALADRELYENRVRLERQLTKALPLVSADRVQMQQVLLNLIMNGIESMAAVTNRPRSLCMQSRIDDSGVVLVAVRDSGTGLSSEAHRLFTPFFTTKANGMGMGLSISRSLVESHGGRLWAEPNSPHGAVFCFTLPESGGSAS